MPQHCSLAISSSCGMQSYALDKSIVILPAQYPLSLALFAKIEVIWKVDVEFVLAFLKFHKI